MTYTGSSCEDIYKNNPETGETSGYYRINDNQWTYCDMASIATYFSGTAGVGGESLTSTSLLEINAPLDGVQGLYLVLMFVL